MIWLALGALIIILIIVLRKRFREQHEILLPPAIADVDIEDEYVIAVITAAIHEFTGTGEFEVVRIRPSAHNWILTGRQNLLANK